MKVLNWRYGEPTDNKHEDCIFSEYEGKWRVLPCEIKHRAFCELRCDDII